MLMLNLNYFLNQSNRTQRRLWQERESAVSVVVPVPYGFTLASDGKTLQVCAQEQKVITLVKRLKRKGHSLGEIAMLLSKQQTV